MTKVLAITLEEKYKQIKAQEIKFVKDKGLQLLNGEEGSGKTTIREAFEMFCAGKQHKSFKDKYANSPLKGVAIFETKEGYHAYLRLDEKNNFKLSILDPKTGKTAKALTPSKFQETISNQFTFSLDEFRHGTGSEQTEFIKKIYEDKLSELGIVFNKRNKNYKGSKFEEYQKACDYRTNILQDQVRPLNASQKALIEDGFCDKSGVVITNFEDIDIKALESELKDLEKELMSIDILKENNLEKIKKEGISLSEDIKTKEKESKTLHESKVALYNLGLEKFKNELKNRIKEKNDKRNKDISLLNSEKEKAEKIKSIVLSMDIDVEESKNEIISKCNMIIDIINSRIKGLPELLTFEKEFKDDDYAEAPKYKEPDCSDIENQIKQKRIEYKNVENGESGKVELQTKIKTIESKIAQANKDNDSLSRINAYESHREADGICKKIMDEIIKSMVSLNLGVDGLKLDVIEKGDDFDVRLWFNSEQSEYAKYFDNKSHLFSGYSKTQKEVLTVLLQVAELDKKDTAIRCIWTEEPKTSKTLELLETIAIKHNCLIFHENTTDAGAVEGSGELCIENGHLLIG